MNSITLLGRLTADIETRYTQSQMAVARFTLAVDRKGKDKGADFINCVAFDKQAETLEKYVGKGCRIVIEGHIQTGSYTKQDGTKAYTTDVITDRFTIVDWKDNKQVDDALPNFEEIDEACPF